MHFDISFSEHSFFYIIDGTSAKIAQSICAPKMYPLPFQVPSQLAWRTLSSDSECREPPGKEMLAEP